MLNNPFEGESTFDYIEDGVDLREKKNFFKLSA